MKLFLFGKFCLSYLSKNPTFFILDTALSFGFYSINKYISFYATSLTALRDVKKPKLEYYFLLHTMHLQLQADTMILAYSLFRSAVLL